MVNRGQLREDLLGTKPYAKTFFFFFFTIYGAWKNEIFNFKVNSTNLYQLNYSNAIGITLT